MENLIKTCRTKCVIVILLVSGIVMLNACKKEKLATVTTSEITEITKTSAKCGWNVTDDGNCKILQRGVCWSTTPNPTTEDAHSIDYGGKGRVKCVIKELIEGTTYYVRAYVVNVQGTSYGEQRVLKTESLFSVKESFTDSRDGNVYSVIILGWQTWMAENLRYLPSVSAPNTGSYGSDPYYYVYGYNGTNVEKAKETDNYSTYGVLYNWAAANIACPSGWHLPSYNEWYDLEQYLGGENVAGGKMKEKWTSHWNSPNTGATNSSGFSALPAGYRYWNGGDFYGINTNTYFWSASYNDSYNAINFSLDDNSSSLFYNGKHAKGYGYSVRCVKDY